MRNKTNEISANLFSVICCIYDINEQKKEYNKKYISITDYPKKGLHIYVRSGKEIHWNKMYYKNN